MVLTAVGKQAHTSLSASMGKVSGDVAAAVEKLKDTGNRMFAKRQYEEALKEYDTALSTLPADAAQAVDLLCNKAACYYQMKK